LGQKKNYKSPLSVEQCRYIRSSKNKRKYYFCFYQNNDLVTKNAFF
jgi:hypothetical protein